MPYTRAKVPACAHDNNEVFAKVEQRIEAGTFSEDELYLWAFKIHAGFGLLRMRLKERRSDPASGPISVLGLRGEHLEKYYSERVKQFRQLVGVWKTPGHQFRPSPVGSVFVLDSLTPEYDFFHLPNGYLGVNLGSTFLAIALFDGGDAKRQAFERYWSQEEASRAFPPTSLRGGNDGKDVGARFYQRYWLCKLAYMCDRAGITNEMRFTSNEAILSSSGPIDPILPDDHQLWVAYLQLAGLHVYQDDNGKPVISNAPKNAKKGAGNAFDRTGQT